MIALTSDLPRKSSRTRTQAVIVPSTAFNTATASDATSVSLSAATASGEVIASQNDPKPSCLAVETRAAIGNTTITVRNVVTMPRDRAVEALSPEIRDAARGAATVAVSASDPTHPMLDRREDALVGVEERRLHLAPAAQPELVDREQPRARRELLPVRVEDALQDRPVAVVGEYLLCRRCAQESQEGVGGVLVRAVLEHRDRVLDQDGRARDHVLHGLLRQLCCDRLALVREQHVALAGEERVERVARARVLDVDVLEQRQQVRLSLLRRLALLDPGSVGGHDVPAGAAGGERVRRDHRD